MRVMMALFFILAAGLAHGVNDVASASPAGAAERYVRKALELRLHERAEWRRLLHYRSRLFGGWESEADGSAFFVAPDGRIHPQNEMVATIRGFFSGEERTPTDPAGPPQSVRCQFPARWIWLSKALGINEFEIPKATCDKFEEFKARLNASSATLVFSAYYVNNPSSAFGHTLLRLNKSTVRSVGAELLDSGINYAANPTTRNPVLYSIAGMAGWFKGTFSFMPYYYKVREYNDFDSRDLWEYELNLTQDEIDQLVAHIWEVGSTYFDYYYFTENCSYHMLTLLDVAAPRLNVTSRIPFYVIPVDTVKAAAGEPGLIRAVKLRPSIHSQLSARLAGLSSAEVSAFHRLSRKLDYEPDELGGTDPRTAARILDALADAIDFTHTEELIQKDAKISEWKQKVLVARSQLPVGEILHLQSAVSARPDISHGAGRIKLGGGRDRNGGGAVQAQIRFALHDWLDPLDGYPSLSTVEFLQVTGRYRDQDSKLALEDFRLVNVASLSPITAFSRRASWRVGIGADRVTDRRCRDCVAGLVSALGGGSISLSRKSLAYGLFGPQLSGSSDFVHEDWTVEAVATLGTRFVFSDRWIALAEAEWRRVFHDRPFETRRLELTTRWTPNLRDGIELQGAWIDGRSDAVISYVRFF